MKKLWFAFHAVLIALTLCASIFDAETLFGISGTISIMSAYPCNLLFGWLFFAFGDLRNETELFYIFMMSNALAGYLQWFVVVPKLVKYLRRQVSVKDWNIRLAFEAQHKSVWLPSRQSNDIDEWRRSQTVSDRRSPVERLIDDSE